MRLTTRSRATAEAIAGCVPFTTSGSLRGEGRAYVHEYAYSGQLNTVEAQMLYDDRTDYGVDYIVWSYSTPIAWHRTDGKWRVVAQTFSPTTSKHQGNLYLIEREEHEVVIVKTGTPGMRHRVRCHTCNADGPEFPTVDSARRWAHGHRFNHDHPAYSI